MTVNHGVLGSSPCSGAFREFSSAGSEHLPYKQRVGGSNPSTPTNQTSKKMLKDQHLFCFILHWSNLFGLRQYKTKVDDYRLWLAAGLNSPAASATERACGMKRLANIARSIRQLPHERVSILKPFYFL